MTHSFCTGCFLTAFIKCKPNHFGLITRYRRTMSSFVAVETYANHIDCSFRSLFLKCLVGWSQMLGLTTKFGWTTLNTGWSSTVVRAFASRSRGGRFRFPLLSEHINKLYWWLDKGCIKTISSMDEEEMGVRLTTRLNNHFIHCFSACQCMLSHRLSLSFTQTLSLSLSHTHTHAHERTNTFNRTGTQPSPAGISLPTDSW